MIPVFLTSDENYAKYMSVTIQSVIEGTKEKVAFYILDGGIERATADKIKNQLKNTKHSIEFIKIDLSLFQNFPDIRHFSMNTYFRYLIPDIKPKLKKILYIDTDMTIAGDVAEIYQTDLFGKGLGAVPYLEETYNKKEYQKYKQNLGLSAAHSYFNAGLLLIDCDYWRQHNVTQTLFEKTNLFKNQLKMPDQDVLNLVFEQNYHILPPQYNIVADVTSTYFDFDAYFARFQGCRVIHYTGGKGVRPWVKQDVPGQKLFWKFALKTPFFDNLKFELLLNQTTHISNELQAALPLSSTLRIRLFNILPILTIKTKQGRTKVYLFGIVLLLTIRRK